MKTLKEWLFLHTMGLKETVIIKYKNESISRLYAENSLLEYNRKDQTDKVLNSP